MKLSIDFRKRIEAARQALEAISEEQSRQPIREGGWLRKQWLGHLLDSAANNHVRFAFAATVGSYEGPAYAQREWVDLQNYAALSWASLLNDWRTLNERLARVVDGIPEAQLGAMCKIGTGDPVTLEFLIQDYLDHLEHHIGQLNQGA
jgi:hypothetical protein